jgi:hypothetical protein
MRKIILLFALLNIFLANAQWTTDTAVNMLGADSMTKDAKSISTNDGRTYMVFYKQVLSPANYEMRVQLLNADGEKQFGPDGILVSNTIPMSTYTFIWRVYTDKFNNLYIALTSTGAGNNGYVFKFNTAGESLWPGGINVGTGLVPAVLPLSNTDVLISWWPGSGKAKVQRYTEAGIAIWAAPIDVSPAANYSAKATIVADMFEMENGDFTAAFHTKLSYQPTSLFYAQRYSATGEAQWAAPTQLTEKNTVYNTYYSSAQDGDVIYYGYTLLTGTRFDAFAQRLNPDGTTPWGLNGIDADVNATYYEKGAEMAFEPGSQYIWTIHQKTPSTQDIVGEYIQKYDKVTGARQFTDNAKEVFAVDNNYRNHASDLYLLNDQPLFLISSGFNSGASPIPLSAVFLDGNGNLLPNGLVQVATFAAAKGNVTLNKPVNNYAVLTFTEEKVVEEPKFYAQRFSTLLDVPCTVTPLALADVTSQCAVTAADLTAPVATDSCGNTVTPTTNAVFPITQGTTAITWTYTTTTGATATQTQNIIVNDTTAPVLTVQNIAVTVAEDKTVSLTAAQFDNGSTDACGGNAASIWTWSVAPASFTCANVGEQTVTITATDVNGNIATATATVTITDPNNYCTTAGVGAFDQKQMTMYPNPTQDIFNISSPTAITSVVVYDMLGKVVFRASISNDNATIDAGAWSKGVYNVAVENVNGEQQKLKLVKN